MFKVKCTKDLVVSGRTVYKEDSIYCVKRNEAVLMKSEYEVRSNLGVGVFDEKKLNEHFRILQQDENEYSICVACNCGASMDYFEDEDDYGYDFDFEFDSDSDGCCSSGNDCDCFHN